jgi:predicted phosphodiesterase
LLKPGDFVRVLLTAGFRFNLQWLNWLVLRGEAYDLVVLAGDLLDAHSRYALPQQTARVVPTLRTLAAKQPLAICSGNHDAIDLPVSTNNGIRPGWLNTLSNCPFALLDGQSRYFASGLTVTVLGYLSEISQKRASLQVGRRFWLEHGGRWLVVHHAPPAFTASSGQEECAAGQLLQEFSPSVWCSSRYLRQPYREEFRCSKKIGITTVVNVAQVRPDGTRLTSAVPKHLVWDVETNHFSWYGSDLSARVAAAGSKSALPGNSSANGLAPI